MTELSELKERVVRLEKEVAELRRLIETHLRQHGLPTRVRPDIPPEAPFKPDHNDLMPPKEF